VSKTISNELNSRAALPLAAGTSATAGSYTFPQATGPAVHPSDIVMMDAVTLANAIGSRQVSCLEVMTSYLDHIEKINPHVNAVVALQDPPALLAQARERDSQLARGEWMGPLHGFPHAVKNLVSKVLK
jgi:amidase